jgi:hypothetical protein
LQRQVALHVTGQSTTERQAKSDDHHGKIVGARWIDADGKAIPQMQRFALEFDGKTSDVRLPTLRYDASHPLTIEAWVELTGNNVNPRIIGNDGPSKGAGNGGLMLQFTKTGSIGFMLQTTSKNVFAATRLPAGRHHLALVCDQDEARLYIDGKKSLARPGKYAEIKRSVAPFRIGAHSAGDSETHRFKGTIDEIRFSKTARYTKDFLPTSRFEGDKNTMALYHFDEGVGDVLKDSSGHGHHGKITAVKWVRFDGRLSDSKTLDPNRAAAEWVLRAGGSISIYQQGKSVTPIAQIQDLPQGRFVVSVLSLRSSRPGTAELKLLDSLTDLTQIDLGGTPLGPHRLEFLTGNKGLRHVRLLSCGIADGDLQHLSGLTQLTTLDLVRNSLTDKGLKHLSGLKNLDFLDLQSNPGLSDDGLQSLFDLTKLTRLKLEETSVTEAGVITLGTVLTNCAISYTKDGKTVEFKEK